MGKYVRQIIFPNETIQFLPALMGEDFLLWTLGMVVMIIIVIRIIKPRPSVICWVSGECRTLCSAFVCIAFSKFIIIALQVRKPGHREAKLATQPQPAGFAPSPSTLKCGSLETLFQVPCR